LSDRTPGSGSRLVEPSDDAAQVRTSPVVLRFPLFPLFPAPDTGSCLGTQGADAALLLVER